MKLQKYTVPLLSLLCVALLIWNGVQYVVYRDASAKVDRVIDGYVRTAVGNLLDARDELNSIKLPVAAADSNQIEATAAKLSMVQNHFQMYLDLNPKAVNRARVSALIMGVQTSSGALMTMVKSGDYRRFDEIRTRVDALASPFSPPLDADFLPTFEKQLSKLPASGN